MASRSYIGNYIHHSRSGYLNWGTKYPNTKKDTTTAQGVFDKHRSNLMRLLREQRGKIIDPKIIQDLEDTLTELYYSKENKAELQTKRANEGAIIEKLLSKQVLQWIIDWEKNGIVYSNTKVKGHLGEIEGFQPSTLRSLIGKLQAAVDDLGTNPGPDNLKRYKAKINETIETCKKLWEELERTSKNEIALNEQIKPEKLERNEKGDTLLKTINQNLNNLANWGYTTAFGVSGEAAIALIDDRVRDQIISGVIMPEAQDIIIETIKEQGIMTGSKTAYLGDKTLSFDRFTTDVVDKLQGYNEQRKQKIVTKVPVEGIKGGQIEMGFELEDNTTAKMDINLKYQGEDFRVSSKNYKFKSKDKEVHLLSSETSLLNLLMRTGSNNFINHYLNITATRNERLGGDNFNTLLNQAHEAAKISIIIEAMSGVSQRFSGKNNWIEGYANYMIINNHADKMVKVIDMYSLAETAVSMIQANQTKSPFEVTGYDKIQLYHGNLWEEYTITVKGKTKSIPNKDAAFQRITRLLSYVRSVKVKASMKTASIPGFWKSNKS